jgi:hypothetical protein
MLDAGIFRPRLAIVAEDFPQQLALSWGLNMCLAPAFSSFSGFLGYLGSSLQPPISSKFAGAQEAERSSISVE